MEGKDFTDLLIRRTPHYQKELLKDYTPTSGWVGQVPTGEWPAFTGTSRIGHRIRRMFPNLSGKWKTTVESGCIGEPCDPTRKKVGFGYDQFEYHLEEDHYTTDIFCFPLIMSADEAKSQYAALVEGLRQATVWIWNHRFRSEAVRICDSQVLCGSNFQQANPQWNADDTVMHTSGAPTSSLTVQFLQRYVQPLILEGYLDNQPLPMKGRKFEVITDMITSTKLVQENPNLKDYVTALSVDEFKELFRYGIMQTVGDFMLHLDPTPLRYSQISATVYNVVLPYENTPAAGGIGADPNWAWINAYAQWDFIWHRRVMKSLVRRSAPINSQMPFSSLDWGGRWKFVMDNMTITEEDGTIVPVNNEERTKGKFIANFSAGTMPDQTKWGVAILSLLEQSCVVDHTPCVSAYSYVSQDYSSANDPCPQSPILIDIPAEGPFVLGSASCNGVALSNTPKPAGNTVAELITFLNATLGAYGTFTAGYPGMIVMTGSTCASLTLEIYQGSV
jgi:hypothetical protein